MDLDLIWIWIRFGSGLLLVGFGLVWLGFWSILALMARVALQGSPRDVLGGDKWPPRKLLGEVTEAFPLRSLVGGGSPA